MERAYPRKETPPRAALGFGDFDTVVDVLAKAAGAASPYLMGAQFTAADVIIGSGLRWGMMFKLLPERPEFTAYVGRLNERPALKRATEKDAKLQKEQEGLIWDALSRALSALGLPRLARGVAPVALGLALGRLGGVADHLLDRLAPLARLALDLLDGLARGALLGFLGLLGLALALRSLAGLGNGRALVRAR